MKEIQNILLSLKELSKGCWIVAAKNRIIYKKKLDLNGVPYMSYDSVMDNQSVLYDDNKGHIDDWKDPDIIHLRPDLYGDYVDQLAVVLQPDSSASDRAAIKGELNGAIDTAVNTAVVRTNGRTPRNSINDKLAAEYTTDEIGNLVRDEADKTDVVVDRFEDHNLSHTEIFNSVDQDIENSGIDVKSDNLIDLVDNHKNPVQEALEKLERKNDSSED